MPKNDGREAAEDPEAQEPPARQRTQDRLHRAGSIPKEMSAEGTAHYREMAVQAVFSGPLPSPDDIARYEQILPGAAERIMAHAEREQAHRHQHDDRALAAEISYSRLGMWLGATALFTCIGAATICAFIGEPGVAIAIAGVGVAGIIGAFIRGRSLPRGSE